MANREDQLADEIAKIHDLAKQDKNIKTEVLLDALFQKAQTATLPAKEKTRAYLVSLLVPPFGLYYVAKFFGRAETDARATAWICLVLTAISVWLYLGFAGLVGL